MKFIDEAVIDIAAGNGGAGCASFRREKFVPFGGPDGGDGGRGGCVIALADANLNTLVDFRYARRHEAGHGESGRGADQFGAARRGRGVAHAGGNDRHRPADAAGRSPN